MNPLDTANDKQQGIKTGSTYRAPYWLRSTHLQTIWGPIIRKQEVPERRMQKFVLSDGDCLWLSWCGPELKKGAPCVLVLHGLSGCSDSHYAISLQRYFMEQGITSVVMNCRGAGGRYNNRALGYHAGEIDDLDEVVRFIHRVSEHGAILPVGVSLGGSRLLNWLAQKNHRAVQSAVAVSVPLELHRCSSRLDRGLSIFYRNNFMKTLLPEWEQKRLFLLDHAPEEANRIESMGDLSRIRSFWEYDERIIAPLYGFENAAEYYQQCSSRAKLKDIQTNTLILHAKDDPFMTRQLIPEESELGPGVTFELAETGGHVGFVYGSPARPRYYLEERIPQWFAPFLNPL